MVVVVVITKPPFFSSGIPGYVSNSVNAVAVVSHALDAIIFF